MGKMPPGYRFYPTEEELVSFYLPQQLEGKRTDLNLVIPVVHVYEHEPWDLPKFSGEMCRGDIEQWFYFSPRQDRGGRPNRSTSCGYWKATGSPSYIYSSDNRVIGMKKTMVFYKGKAPTGTKTKWKMNEYRAIQQSNQQMSSLVGFTIPKLRHELSLCRVYVVSGSFRAFDRRPIGAEISETSNQQANGGEDVESPQEPQTEENTVGNSSFIYQNIQTLSQVTNTNSPETSYSAEYQIEQVLQQQEQQNDLGMDNSVAHAAEHLWDWEQLINWP